jgi:hypothetical protein
MSKEKRMDRNSSKAFLGTVVMFGAVWGFSEAALGMWLRTCASTYSGTIMTAVALFFMAGSWVLTRSVLGITLIVCIASMVKLFDAMLLSLPIRHGAISNPIFAFFMEGLAFLILILIFNDKLKQKVAGKALFGGVAALLAVNLFPLVKYATGIPACVFPGSGFPLSLYYAPLAVVLSSISVPLGFFAGEKIKVLEAKWENVYPGKKLGYILSPATLLLCLAIIAFMRIL